MVDVEWRGGNEYNGAVGRSPAKERLAGVRPLLLGLAFDWPQLGRFCSRDPITHGNGTHLFAYGRCNPLVVRDPSGLKCDDAKGSHPPARSPLLHARAEHFSPCSLNTQTRRHVCHGIRA